jgi:hypothetical protein
MCFCMCYSKRIQLNMCESNVRFCVLNCHLTNSYVIYGIRVLLCRPFETELSKSGSND